MGDRRAADPGVEGAVAGRGYRMRLMRRRSPERRSTLLRLGRPEAEQGGVLGHFTSIYGHAEHFTALGELVAAAEENGAADLVVLWRRDGTVLCRNALSPREPGSGRWPRPGRCRPNRGGPTPSRRTPGSGRCSSGCALYCVLSPRRGGDRVPGKDADACAATAPQASRTRPGRCCAEARKSSRLRAGGLQLHQPGRVERAEPLRLLAGGVPKPFPVTDACAVLIQQLVQSAGAEAGDRCAARISWWYQAITFPRSPGCPRDTESGCCGSCTGDRLSYAGDHRARTPVRPSVP